jgi:hypothetical protein
MPRERRELMAAKKKVAKKRVAKKRVAKKSTFEVVRRVAKKKNGRTSDTGPRVKR